MDMSVCCCDWLRGDDIIAGNTAGGSGLSPIWSVLSLMTAALSLRWRDASDDIGKSGGWSWSSSTSVQSLLLTTGRSWKPSSAIFTTQTEIVQLGFIEVVTQQDARCHGAVDHILSANSYTHGGV